MIPVIVGFCIGGAVLFMRKGRLRSTVSVACILLTAVTATLLSGEFRQSWWFAAVDLAEVTAGFVSGSLVVRWFAQSWRSRTGVIARH